MSVGENIRRIREQRGLQQAQLADQIGVSQPFICQVERGTKLPSLPVSAEIAKALNCSLSDLMAE